MHHPNELGSTESAIGECLVPDEEVADRGEDAAVPVDVLDRAHDRHVPMQRRQSDRPLSLMIELVLQYDQSPDESVIATSTLIDVTIRTKRSRDRRHDSGARADQLLHSLKSYLIAEEC